MLVDTGRSRSCVPNAYTRIGCEAGGCETTQTHTGVMYGLYKEQFSHFIEK